MSKVAVVSDHSQRYLPVVSIYPQLPRELCHRALIQIYAIDECVASKSPIMDAGSPKS